MPGFLALIPWIIGGLTAATAVASYTAAKKAQKAAKRPNDEQRGVLLNKESNVEQIPVIYGERRVGGVRVFVSTDGTYKTVGGTTNWYSGYHPDTEVYDDVTGTPTNEYLYVALVLAEGEVESITDIYVDDIPITDAKYTGLINYNIYLGTDDQTMPDSHYLREANEFWTADHRLRGVAFIGLRFKWDEEAFSGIPDVTALVKGRKVYDPRTETTAWSDNPALAIRDYLTNTRYGKGIPLSAIDDTAIIAAANDCDESVTEYAGGTTGKLFTCNAVLDTSKTLFDNLNILLLGCRGFLPYSQGQYRLKIDGSSASQFTFTKDEIIGGIVITGESKDEKLNRVSVKFPNPDANWQPDTAIWPPAGSSEETAFLAADGGVLLQEDIDLDTITSYYQARDLARVLVLRSRNALTCSIKTTSEALQLEIADVVSITHPTPGWTAKPFQVTQMQLNEDGTVSLNLLEYDSTIYTWEEGTEQTSYPDTNLPDPFTVAAVSNITITETTTLGSDGTVIPTGLIEWDSSYDNLVNQYEIQYKLTSEADTEFKSLFTSVPKYEFYNAEVGISVTIRIRAINSLNVKGAFTTATFTVNGDQTAPNAPTGLSATFGIKNIRLDWTNPSASDLKVIDVYRHTSNSSGSASKIASIDGESFVDQNITEDITYYYWLKARDYSDNTSGFSGVASAAATLVTSDGIVEGAIDVAKFASGIEPVSLVTSVPATKSTEVIYNTTDNILYRWDGSAYVAATGVTDFSQLTGNVTAAQFAATIEPVTLVTSVPVTKITETIYNTTNNTLYRWDGSAYVTVQGASDFSELTGTVQTAQIAAAAVTATKLGTAAVEAGKIAVNAVTEATIATNAITTTKISDGAIETAKLAAGSVTATQIAANTITASQIAANTITASQIAAGAISATEIAAGAVTTAKLAALAITADKIAANTITAAKIATGTITANEIASNTITAGQIAAGAISTSELAVGAVGSTNIADDAITAAKILDGSITATLIGDGQIITSKLSANAVTGDKIAANTITANEILANTITAGQIAAGAITATELAADSVSVSKLVSNTSKSYGNFQFEFGTSTSVAGFTGAGILRGAQANAFGVAGLGNGDPCVAVAGQQSYNGADSYGAYFANSLFLGGTTHRSQAGICNNTRAGIFAAGSRQVELANSTYAVATVGDMYVNGNITATGTITPFTGMHDGLIDDSVSPEIGDIMVDTEVVIRRDISNTLCAMAISSQQNQAAIGIYCETMPDTYVPSSARTPDSEDDIENFEQISSEARINRDPQYDSVFVDRKSVIVNSVGEGQINVCGEGGDIAAGDLIVTSSIPGKGMKQGDDIIRSYTVAKARESATFSAGEVKQIACIYLCG